ncbi:NAD-dependent epimerase/dehydratase family protein [Emticicia sp. CRIBPO]|uniref:NAD-dependent epimerase/dehydratase family protein n=1 Tax=Emticicia sp. CRIBPO TaxID=2683258 RepID=UPI001412AAA5|nr:NAD-dependent epimerase/dehydratase family protein [Emticicia sp. CRIBPO]NBA85285.1 NAD-dependent epimerase/dehydratase family protein [Emticicia sp. CRIBPO]
MKVLVLGGTGAMGVHLIQLLSSNDVDTVVTSRRDRESVGKTRYVKGDANNIDFLRTILEENWDAIVDFMVYSTPGFKERVNLLLDATSQYVFLSSARVYAESQQPIIETSSRLLDVSEDREFLSTDEYSLTKARQEDILRDSGRKNWTIVRPYITYSESRLQLGVLEKEEWLYRALNGRTIVFSKDINSKETTLTYGLDVSTGINSLIGISKSLGETFHITTKDSHTWNYILNIYLEVLEDHLGYKPKVLFQDLDRFLEFRPAKYQVIYDRFFNRKFDSSKIDHYVNTNSFTRIDEGLKKCLEEFLKNPKFNDINWKSEALKDRQMGENTPLSEIKGILQKMKYLTFRYSFFFK